MSATPRRLAVVAPLSPVRSDIAREIARQLPTLARRVELVLVCDDPNDVDGRLVAGHDVRPVDELDELDVDAVVYHAGHRDDTAFVADALEWGPAGVVVLHQPVLRHGGGTGERSDLEHGFGERGRRLAALWAHGTGGGIDVALFDRVAPLLDRHRAAVVHSSWAAGLVRRRVPGLPLAVVEHAAPEPVPPLPRIDLGLPAVGPLVGVLSGGSGVERIDLVLEAIRHLADRGGDVHLVLGTSGPVDDDVAALVAAPDLAGRVTVATGLSDRAVRALAGTVDVVVALPGPGLIGSPYPVLAAAAAGTPPVVWPVGADVDVPPEARVDLPVGGDEGLALAETLEAVLASSARRSTVGAAALRWATEALAVERGVDGLIGAVAAAPEQVHERVVIDRPWGALVGPRRPGRVAVTAAEPDGAALRDAGWHVRVIHGAADARRAPVGWADLVVWEVGSDEHVDREVLDALHRCLHPTGRLVVRPPAASYGRTLAAALASAGFGAGGTTTLAPVEVDGEVAIVAHKVGAGR